MLIKTMITHNAQGQQNSTRRMLCLEYTLYHNQKKKQQLYTSNSP